MSQAYKTVPIVSTEGTRRMAEVAALMNGSYGALLTTHIGSARPSYASEGTFWIAKDGTTLRAYVYNGSDDTLIFTMTEGTDEVTLNASSGITVGQVNTLIATAVDDIDFTIDDGTITADMLATGVIPTIPVQVIEANTLKNSYPESARIKLATIETDAKDDQTGNEIVDLLTALTGTDQLDAAAIKGLPTDTGGSGLTTAQERKLAGIADDAEVNVNADWNATSGDARILNKPADANVPDASMTAKGIVELSNQTEARNGTDNTRVMTPFRTKDVVDRAVAVEAGNRQTRDNTLGQRITTEVGTREADTARTNALHSLHVANIAENVSDIAQNSTDIAAAATTNAATHQVLQNTIDALVAPDAPDTGLTQGQVDARIEVKVENFAETNSTETIPAARLGRQSVETSKLAASSVSTAKIQDNAVTLPKLAAGVLPVIPTAEIAANTAKRSYPTSAQTKLGTIETDAKDDQTGDEIVDLLGSLSGTARLPASSVKDLPTATSGEDNVNADWNATSGDARILNKPTDEIDANTAKRSYTTSEQAKVEKNKTDLAAEIATRSTDDTTLGQLIVDAATANATTHQNLQNTINTLTAPTAPTSGLTQAQVDARIAAEVENFAEVDSIETIPTARFGRQSIPGSAFVSRSITAGKIADNAVTLPKLAAGVLPVIPTAEIAANTAKRSYPTSAQTKLGTIETNAKDDQTGDEIVDLLEALSGTDKLPASAIRDLPDSTGGEDNVNADWNATSGDAQILNKPNTISAQERQEIATDTSKLATIETGAEVNINSDWNQTQTDEPNYIRNKPTIIDPTNLINIEASSRRTADNLKQNTLTAGTNITISSDNTISSAGSTSTTGEDNVTVDWNQTNTNSDAYIRNKPTDAIAANTAKRTFPISQQTRNNNSHIRSQANETKLLTIESNAKDDQTAGEIVDLLEELSGVDRLPASAIRDLPASTGGGLTETQAKGFIKDFAEEGNTTDKVPRALVELATETVDAVDPEYSSAKSFGTPGLNQPKGITIYNGNFLIGNQGRPARLYGFNVETRARAATADFGTLAPLNDDITGVAQSATHIYAADYGAGAVFAYRKSNKAYDTALSFSTNNFNGRPIGVVVIGDKILVSQASSARLFLYEIAAPHGWIEFSIPNHATGHTENDALWYDGTYLYCVAKNTRKVYVYNYETKIHNTERSFTLTGSNSDVTGTWGDGTYLYVSDRADNRIYTYTLYDETIGEAGTVFLGTPDEIDTGTSPTLVVTAKELARKLLEKQIVLTAGTNITIAADGTIASAGGTSTGGLTESEMAEIAANTAKRSYSAEEEAKVALNTAKRTFPISQQTRNNNSHIRSQANETKLLTIESNAKDDQTAGEIVDLLEELSGVDRLPASAIKDLPGNAALTGASKFLQDNAVKRDKPTVTKITPGVVKTQTVTTGTVEEPIVTVTDIEWGFVRIREGSDFREATLSSNTTTTYTAGGDLSVDNPDIVSLYTQAVGRKIILEVVHTLRLTTASRALLERTRGYSFTESLNVLSLPVTGLRVNRYTSTSARVGGAYDPNTTHDISITARDLSLLTFGRELLDLGPNITAEALESQEVLDLDTVTESSVGYYAADTPGAPNTSPGTVQTIDGVGGYQSQTSIASGEILFRDKETPTKWRPWRTSSGAIEWVSQNINFTGSRQRLHLNVPRNYPVMKTFRVYLVCDTAVTLGTTSLTNFFVGSRLDVTDWGATSRCSLQYLPVTRQFIIEIPTNLVIISPFARSSYAIGGLTTREKFHLEVYMST